MTAEGAFADSEGDDGSTFRAVLGRRFARTGLAIEIDILLQASVQQRRCAKVQDNAVSLQNAWKHVRINRSQTAPDHLNHG